MRGCPREEGEGAQGRRERGPKGGGRRGQREEIINLRVPPKLLRVPPKLLIEPGTRGSEIL